MKTFSAALVALSLSLGLALPAAAQLAPKTPEGRPDLSGNWTNASLTWLERPATLKG